MGFRGYRTSRDRACVARDALGTLRALRLLPVVAQQLPHPDVVPAAVAVDLFALDPALAVAGPLERAARGVVLHERARANLVKAQLAEAEARPQGHRLGRDPLTPERLLADDDR